MNLEIPLITPVSLKYYNKARIAKNDTYYRALDIRLCLEKISNDLLLQFFSSDEQTKWNKLTLHDKLKKAETFMDPDIVNNIINTKIIGNNGVHEGEEANLKPEDIQHSLNSIQEFSLEIFLAYFKKFGFFHPNDSWVPVIFSTLPPIYRVKILKKYFQYDKSIHIIDKLAMALLKSNMIEESYSFIKYCLENKYLNEYEYYNFLEKLNILEEKLDKLPISQNFVDSKKNFNNLLDSIPENERDSFAILVSMILNG
ncbi:hypothetical protein IRP63_12195 [Clostridium botulinum]|uniref:DUF4145 domain-containing protein n=1 Tax=Clostridium botulinum C/D str. DC5 TaxID=1443128 RepID=A0A0A0IL33_CLOBO|nr:hypothetical protein [Clostridium botulinum]KGN00957.1 hypothetical protein Z955_02310 [Clostridium botulinum C/D str. DC5]KOC50062.1 hypothetical protein ADU89_14885 [Clostridium botulinum]KOC52518.1 hypothetical protein ADU90_14475 [Clostridium botulinum]MCD3235479.1 hypothetical protein [Clostridium botulinum D/C]MCD3241419.1 hypothetical protein [Clostridium botulinum D/C]